MSKKKAFVLRIDPKKLDAVEKWAEDEFRSINGQIEWILDQALKKTGRFKKKPYTLPDKDTETEK
ncbi:MAG: Arc family DNA-binding protein [Bacteroidota bacterium]|nr:Arc family DNA-binding protein [Bacteroidota bacterium]